MVIRHGDNPAWHLAHRYRCQKRSAPHDTLLLFENGMDSVLIASCGGSRRVPAW
jgi:hypothetical protein